MTDEEIARMTSEMDEQQQKEMDQQQAQTTMAGPGPGEAGGQEPAENVPPTANEERGSELESLRDLVLEDDKKEVISRIIKKQQEKAQSTTKS